MSWITDVVVHTSMSYPPALTEPLPFDARGQSFQLVITDDAGGNKVFCDSVFAASFNHLDRAAFQEWIVGLGLYNATVSMHGEVSNTVLVIVEGQLVAEVTSLEMQAGTEISVNDIRTAAMQS